MNLDKMNLDELSALKRDVERTIATFEERRRKEALAAAEAVVRKYGMSLSELTGAGRGRRSATGVASAMVAPKYRNPNNHSQTWSGRGRRPAWIGDRNLDDLLI